MRKWTRWVRLPTKDYTDYHIQHVLDLKTREPGGYCQGEFESCRGCGELRGRNRDSRFVEKLLGVKRGCRVELQAYGTLCS